MPFLRTSCPHQWNGSTGFGHLPHCHLLMDLASSHHSRLAVRSPTIAVVKYTVNVGFTPTQSELLKTKVEDKDKPRAAWAVYKERLREGLDVEHCGGVVLFGCARILLTTLKFPNFVLQIVCRAYCGHVVHKSLQCTQFAHCIPPYRSTQS